MTDAQAVPLPDTAVHAAAQAIYPETTHNHMSGNEMLRCERIARLALAAAAPALRAQGAAAERERWLRFAHEHAEDDEQCCLRGAATWLGEGETDGH